MHPRLPARNRSTHTLPSCRHASMPPCTHDCWQSPAALACRPRLCKSTPAGRQSWGLPPRWLAPQLLQRRRRGSTGARATQSKKKQQACTSRAAACSCTEAEGKQGSWISHLSQRVDADLAWKSQAGSGQPPLFVHARLKRTQCSSPPTHLQAHPCSTSSPVWRFAAAATAAPAGRSMCDQKDATFGGPAPAVEERKRLDGSAAAKGRLQHGPQLQLLAEVAAEAGSVGGGDLWGGARHGAGGRLVG